jgi:hypothetical protein
MSEEIDRLPYVEGEPAPGPEYVFATMVDVDGKDLGMFWVRLSPDELARFSGRDDRVETTKKETS